MKKCKSSLKMVIMSVLVGLISIMLMHMTEYACAIWFFQPEEPYSK